jgi:Na+/melibiose symporter-like transporter
MAAVDDYLMLQYLMMFAVSIIFSMLAVERGKALTTLVASLCWIITALLSFIYAPTVVGSVAGYMFGVLASVLFAGFIYSLFEQMMDARHSRFEMDRPL